MGDDGNIQLARRAIIIRLQEFVLKAGDRPFIAINRNLQIRTQFYYIVERGCFLRKRLCVLAK